MWDWISDNTTSPGSKEVEPNAENSNMSLEVSSQAGSESDVDIGEDEGNLSRAILRQLRDLRRQQSNYGETVNELSRKVVGLSEEIRRVAVHGDEEDDVEEGDAAGKQSEKKRKKAREKAGIRMGGQGQISKQMAVYWNMADGYQDTFEADYLAAIRRNDYEAVEKLLRSTDDPDLDVTGADGKFGVQIALENEFIDIGIFLFKRGIKIGITFLRLIESDCISAVALICSHRNVFEANGEDIFDVHDTDDEFPAETTPIILAARMNRFQILKILLKSGTVMPTLEDVRSRFDKGRPGRAQAVFHLCEAFSSEAYLLQTSDDLLRDVFNTTEKLRQVRLQEKNSLTERGSRDGFSILQERLVQMELKILDLVRGEEMEILLNGDDCVARRSSATCCRDLPGNIPIRVSQAIEFKQKEFVAHSKCQEYLWERWRRGFDEHMSRSVLNRIAATLFLGTFWPILGLIYLICSGFKCCSTFLRLMRCPYVKFVLSTSSRIILLIILAFALTVENNTILFIDVSLISILPLIRPPTMNAYGNNMEEQYRSYRTHGLQYIIVWIWILGMTWRELTDICRQGFRMYISFGWSRVEIPQLILYWLYIIFVVIAYAETMSVVKNGEVGTKTIDGMKAELERFLSHLPGNHSNIYDDCLQIRDVNGMVSCVRDAHGVDLPSKMEIESRLDWHTFDPLLIAEAMFAVANVLTFLRLQDATVLLAYVGILQVSMVKMVHAVVKFLFLYAFIWVSFGLGLTQLYRPYEDVKEKHCRYFQVTENGNDDECQKTHFTNLWMSMKSLFFTFFGDADFTPLELPPNLYMTDAVGELLFLLYLLLTTLFLMNMLIAMLGGVYESIKANAAIEWKFARSVIMCEYMVDSAVIPPPLNLIPSTRSIIERARTLFACCKRQAQIPETVTEVEMEKMEDMCAKDDMSLDYQILSCALKRRYIRHIMKTSNGISCLDAVTADEGWFDAVDNGSNVVDKDDDKQITDDDDDVISKPSTSGVRV